MYSRKNLGRRMEPSGTPTLTRYSREDFPPRTTQSCRLRRKNKQAKYCACNFIRLECVKGSSMLSLVESIEIPDLLKVLARFSDTTVRKSAVDREDLKPYWKSEKRPHFSRQFLAVVLSPMFFNAGTTDRLSNNVKNKVSSDTKNSVSMQEFSGLQFFDQSRLIMTF